MFGALPCIIEGSNAGVRRQVARILDAETQTINIVRPVGNGGLKDSSDLFGIIHIDLDCAVNPVELLFHPQTRFPIPLFLSPNTEVGGLDVSFLDP